MQICKYFSNPDCLIYNISNCYKFSFICVLNNNILLSWTPREHPWFKVETIVCNTFHIIHKSCPVTIKIALFWQLENVIHYHNVWIMIANLFLFVDVRFIKQPINLLYWPLLALSAPSSSLNFSFYFIELFVLFHFSIWNFFSISLAYFF